MGKENEGVLPIYKKQTDLPFREYRKGFDLFSQLFLQFPLMSIRETFWLIFICMPGFDSFIFFIRVRSLLNIFFVHLMMAFFFVILKYPVLRF